MATNRPHYHVWILARTGRIFYKLKRSFHTQPAATQWAKRNRPEAKRMVLQCTCEKCKPKLE